MSMGRFGVRMHYVGVWRRGAALMLAVYFGALQAAIHGLHTCGSNRHISHSAGGHSGTCHVSSNGDTSLAGPAGERGNHQDLSGICPACLFLRGNNSAAPQALVVVASLPPGGCFLAAPEEVITPDEDYTPQVPRAPPCAV